MEQHLFLNGGGPPLTPNMAKLFVQLATKNNQSLISLLVIDRRGWGEYVPFYLKELQRLGIDYYHLIPLPATPVKKVMKMLNESTGILIGGGDTNLYADCIVETEIGSVIKKRFQEGIPVAGFSAGALISPETCILFPNDNEQNEFQSRNGLGLLSNAIIAVHFSEWEEESHLREGIERYPEFVHYGVDEDTCLYFYNGVLHSVEGKGVYQIEDGNLVKIDV